VNGGRLKSAIWSPNGNGESQYTRGPMAGFYISTEWKGPTGYGFDSRGLGSCRTLQGLHIPNLGVSIWRILIVNRAIDFRDYSIRQDT
jgi:hypothetical protein